MTQIENIDQNQVESTQDEGTENVSVKTGLKAGHWHEEFEHRPYEGHRDGWGGGGGWGWHRRHHWGW